MARQRTTSTWSAKTQAYVERVKATIDGLSAFWPLTLRQIYYALVAAVVIPNRIQEYTKLSRLLTKARLDGVVPWEAIEDRARSMLASGGWQDQQAFVAHETAGYLSGYRRDLLQSQEHAIECWVEKDALSRIFHDVAFQYCVPVIVARGFSSISYVHECRQRIIANTDAGYSGTVVLYFGDLDPSGWEMLPAMMETLQGEMGLGDQVIPRRCALTPEQVDEYDLPHNPEALKWTDSRAKKYHARFGDLAVELDALPPATLQDIVRQSIEAELDLANFEIEREREINERDDLDDLKTRVEEFVESGSQ